MRKFSEIEKLVMSLPDGALVNIVVFSQDVRVWRQEGNRPVHSTGIEVKQTEVFCESLPQS